MVVPLISTRVPLISTRVSAHCQAILLPQLLCVSNIAVHALPLPVASMPAVRFDLTRGLLICLYFIIYQEYNMTCIFAKPMQTWYDTCIYLCWIYFVWVWVLREAITIHFAKKKQSLWTYCLRGLKQSCQPINVFQAQQSQSVARKFCFTGPTGIFHRRITWNRRDLHRSFCLIGKTDGTDGKTTDCNNHHIFQGH